MYFRGSKGYIYFFSAGHHYHERIRDPNTGVKRPTYGPTEAITGILLTGFDFLLLQATIKLNTTIIATKAVFSGVTMLDVPLF